MFSPRLNPCIFTKTSGNASNQQYSSAYGRDGEACEEAEGEEYTDVFGVDDAEVEEEEDEVGDYVDGHAAYGWYFGEGGEEHGALEYGYQSQCVLRVWRGNEVCVVL